MADAQYSAIAGEGIARLSLFEFIVCSKCGLQKPADQFYKRKAGRRKSCCKICHGAIYGRPSAQRSREAYRIERGALLGKRSDKLICWLEQTCIKCGQVKPYTDFRLDKRRGRRRGQCNDCWRAYMREASKRYTRKIVVRNNARLIELRKTEEGREQIRANKRRARDRLVAKGLTTNGTIRIAPPRDPNASKQKIARQAVREHRGRWIREIAPDPCVSAWYAATGKPWNNPRLTQGERWSVRYRTDDVFRAREIIKVQGRKVIRSRRIAEASDGSVTKESLGALFAAAKWCTYCESPMTSTEKTHDHVRSLESGGAHSLENLVICCRSCNCSKGRKSLRLWLTSKHPRSPLLESISSKLRTYWESHPEHYVTGRMLREMTTARMTPLQLSAGSSLALAA
jgi:5-methylcytosine-specific restriction endonuclease McrA